jgi:hypothetical protein
MERTTIASVVRAGIRAGHDTNKILAAVREAFPDANTSPASVAWYRSQMKKEGGKAAPKNEHPKARGGSKQAQLEAAWSEATAKASKAVTTGPDSGPLYTVGAYKPTTGMEGPGFIVKLMRDGKPVAEVSDYGDGGEVKFDWLDRKDSPLVDVVGLNYKDEEAVRKGTKEEAMFVLYCRHLPKWKLSDGETELHTSPDIAVSNMVNDYLLLKKVQRLMKTNVVMVDGGNVYTIKAKGAITPDVLAKVRAKNPSAKVLNDLSVGDVVRILQDVKE